MFLVWLRQVSPYLERSFYRIRGLFVPNSAGNNLINGIPDFVGGRSTGFSNVERVEVLKAAGLCFIWAGQSRWNHQFRHKTAVT